MNPKKLYAFNALAGAVLTSEDGGAHFTVAASDLRSVPEYELQYAYIKAVPDHEGEVWITTKMKLARSSDSGKSFRTVGSVQEAHGVGFGRAAPGQTFPAVYLSGKVNDVTGFFRSDDGGESFIRINDDAHQYGGATISTGDPRVHGRFYVAPGGRGIVYGGLAKQRSSPAQVADALAEFLVGTGESSKRRVAWLCDTVGAATPLRAVKASGCLRIPTAAAVEPRGDVPRFGPRSFARPNSVQGLGRFERLLGTQHGIDPQMPLS